MEFNSDVENKIQYDCTKIWYSRKYNRFFSLKEERETGYICSGFTEYYGDAMSVTARQQLSNSFILNCVPVNNIDEFPFAELCPIVHSWKVKDSKEY